MAHKYILFFNFLMHFSIQVYSAFKCNFHYSFNFYFLDENGM